METICLQCGNRGFANAFVCCVKCLDVAVHLYCLDVIPAANDEFIKWICDDCKEEVQNQPAVLETDLTQCQRSDHTASEHIIGYSRFGTKKNDIVEHHILSYNGSPRSSKKKRTVISSEAKLEDQRYETVFAKDLKESKWLDLDNHCSRMTAEAKGNNLSNGRSENRESEVCKERTSATLGTSNFCTEVPKDSNMVDCHARAEPVTMPTWSLRQMPVGGPGGRFISAHVPHKYMDDDEEVADEQPNDLVWTSSQGSKCRHQNVPEEWKSQEAVPGGPIVIDLIPSFGDHTAFEVWNGKERGVLKCQSRNMALSLWAGPTNANAASLVTNSGLSHLRDSMLPHHNAPLLCAFVERWQPDTNTFHMPFGEMTITLHDVHHILGLPADGRFVSSDTTRDEMVSATAKYLGVAYLEIDGMWNNGGPLLRDISRWCSDKNASAETQAVGYMMYLLGSTLFIDKSSSRVKPVFVPMLEDFNSIRCYAWGAAALAYLFRHLGMASRARCRQLSGCLTLLEAWIYEYFPRFRPAEVAGWRQGQPRAQRWRSSHQQVLKTQEKLMEYRLLLDQMTVKDVVWMPYGSDVVQQSKKTLYHGNIRYMEVIEPYMPNRVLRQFGYVQIIPSRPLKPIKAVRPKNVHSYIVVYPAQDYLWETPAAHCLQLSYYGVRAIPPFEAHAEYLEWYLAHTHPRIQNPVHGSDDDGDEEHPHQPNYWMLGFNAAHALLPVFPENRHDIINVDQIITLLDQAARFLRPFVQDQLKNVSGNGVRDASSSREGSRTGGRGCH